MAGKGYKTATGGIPPGVGFPGTNLVAPRLHPAIQHINCSPEALSDPGFIRAINDLAEKALAFTKARNVKKRKI